MLSLDTALRRLVMVSCTWVLVTSMTTSDSTPDRAAAFRDQLVAYKKMLVGMESYELRSTTSLVLGGGGRSNQTISSLLRYDKGDYLLEYADMVTYGNRSITAVLDPEQGMVFLSEGHDPLAPILGELEDEWMAAITSVEVVNTADGVRYRIKFREGAAYSGMDVQFDKAGWLRELRSTAARSVQLDASRTLSAAVHPVIVARFAVPVPLSPGTAIDLEQVVGRTERGYTTHGAWSEYKVFDTRP